MRIKSLITLFSWQQLLRERGSQEIWPQLFVRVKWIARKAPITLCHKVAKGWISFAEPIFVPLVSNLSCEDINGVPFQTFLYIFPLYIIQATVAFSCK